MGLVDEAVAAIRAGQPVILPTDTVYGLCSSPYRKEAVALIGRLKGRPATVPSALLALEIDLLLECVPELRGRAEVIARALLPGPFTLVLANPARRFRWLCGDNPDAIGVRVPALVGAAREVLEQVGAVTATSANHHGSPDPRRLEEVPADLREACAAVIDGGELPGVPSTVVDVTRAEPRILREGAVPAAEALERLAAIPV